MKRDKKKTNNDLQNTTQKTKDRVTRTRLKPGGELRCSGRVGSSCSIANCTFFFSVKTDKNAYWDNVYIPPWCRVSAYCVGMMLGVILLKRPKQKLHWVCYFFSACFPIALIHRKRSMRLHLFHCLTRKRGINDL
jgi:hypothetical protein